MIVIINNHLYYKIQNISNKKADFQGKKQSLNEVKFHLHFIIVSYRLGQVTVIESEDHVGSDQTTLAEDGQLVRPVVGAPATVLEIDTGKRLKVHGQASVFQVTVPGAGMLKVALLQRPLVVPDEEMIDDGSPVDQPHVGADVAGYPQLGYGRGRSLPPLGYLVGDEALLLVALDDGQ